MDVRPVGQLLFSSVANEFAQQNTAGPDFGIVKGYSNFAAGAIRLNQQFSVQVEDTGLPSGASVELLWGFGSITGPGGVPLPWRPSNAAHIDDYLWVSAFDSYPMTQIVQPTQILYDYTTFIPNDPMLLGLQIFVQPWALNPVGSVTFGPLAVGRVGL